MEITQRAKDQLKRIIENGGKNKFLRISRYNLELTSAKTACDIETECNELTVIYSKEIQQDVKDITIDFINHKFARRFIIHTHSTIYSLRYGLDMEE